MKLDPGLLLHFNPFNTAIPIVLFLLYYSWFEALFITFSQTFIGLLLTIVKNFLWLLLHKDYKHMHSKGS